MTGSTEVARAIADKLAALNLDLARAIGAKDPVATLEIESRMAEYTELLPAAWPDIGVHSSVGSLRGHLEFVRYYAGKSNWPWVQSNATDVARDLANVNQELGRLGGRIRPGLEADIAGLPDGHPKQLLTEAVACLKIGAFGSAIVGAGASMEAHVRAVYTTATTKNSKGLTFFEVIGELEALKQGQLRKEETAMVDLVRIYRDYTAHPTEFTDADRYAPPLVELACTVLRPKLAPTPPTPAIPPAATAAAPATTAPASAAPTTPAHPS